MRQWVNRPPLPVNAARITDDGMSQVATERTIADEEVPKPVHPYRSVRLAILSLYLRALAEVLRDLKSEFVLARGWIDSRLDDLKRGGLDLQWKDLVVNPMEIRWRKALAEIRKTLEYAGSVASSRRDFAVIIQMPRGHRALPPPNASHPRD